MSCLTWQPSPLTPTSRSGGLSRFSALAHDFCCRRRCYCHQRRLANAPCGVRAVRVGPPGARRKVLGKSQSGYGNRGVNGTSGSRSRSWRQGCTSGGAATCRRRQQKRNQYRITNCGGLAEPWSAGRWRTGLGCSGHCGTWGGSSGPWWSPALRRRVLEESGRGRGVRVMVAPAAQGRGAWSFWWLLYGQGMRKGAYLGVPVNPFTAAKMSPL